MRHSSTGNIFQLSVQDIKERAKNDIARIKGFSISNTLSSAKVLGERAQAHDNSGDLKEAFYEYTKLAL
jgi:hypothetical protein